MLTDTNPMCRDRRLRFREADRHALPRRERLSRIEPKAEKVTSALPPSLTISTNSFGNFAPVITTDLRDDPGEVTWIRSHASYGTMVAASFARRGERSESAKVQLNQAWREVTDCDGGGRFERAGTATVLDS
jgi:hypothetical protein